MPLTAIVNCPSSLGRAATIASASPIGDGHARATWDLEQNGPRIAGTLDYAALSWFEFPIREAKRPLRNSITFDWRISVICSKQTLPEVHNRARAPETRRSIIRRRDGAGEHRKEATRRYQRRR